MPYILYKSNGSVLATIADATQDNVSTSLTFLGRNFNGYGQVIEDNFLHLLENFSNTTNPSHPIQGQLWFDSTTGTTQLKVFYDPSGTYNKGIASLTVGTTSTVDVPVTGDMVWDTASRSLQIYDQDTGDFIKVGPYDGVGNDTNWLYPTVLHNNAVTSPAIIGTVGSSQLVAFSYATDYSPDITSPYAAGFDLIKPGVTLTGADPVTGSTRAAGYYFWGTAAESLSSVKVQLTSSTSTSTRYVPFAGDASSNGSSLNTATSFTYTPSTGVLNATATSAYYADLAERYEADAVYEVGTVLVIGGDKEVTTTDQFADTRVAGIVSKKPAYLMNSEAGNDETHPAIALKGRVPCKVIGYIEKGDLLVTSAHPGYATAAKSVSAGAVIGKALEKNSEGFAIIEVLVV